MVSPQTMLENMARQACQLICCDASLLVIDCPVPELRHPLLALFPATTPLSARVYGASRLLSLLRNREIRAVCDIACQRGEIQYCSLLVEGEPVNANTIAVAPLCSPAGVLGYILLANAAGFTQGEDALLREFGEDSLQAVESATRILLLANLFQAGTRTRTLKTPDIERDGHQLPEVLNSISMVSHELRSPLAAIKGYAGLLQIYSGAGVEQQGVPEKGTPVLTPALQQRYLNMILEESQRLEELIADLLDVSRAQFGKLALRFSAVDVSAACESAVRRARQRIEQLLHARPRLECRIEPQLPPIHADARRIQDILDNLLDNAIKYSPQGGAIELLALAVVSESNPYEHLHFSQRPRNPQKSPSIVKIIVRDQGIGIPPDQRARLFQPFSRVDHPQMRRVQGVGLGLYITRQLVEAMQGTIDISSKVENGTAVTLCFPVEQSQLNDSATPYVLPTEMSHSLR